MNKYKLIVGSQSPRRRELLKQVGLQDREMQYPDQRSGGQKQRVAIARTLSMDPDIILMDEPTSALDPAMVGEVQAVIRDLAGTGRTMMIVTHEMGFARAICNRVFYMDQGEIHEEGSPEQIFDHPQKELTRRFIRNLKVLELHIKDRTYDFIAADTEIDRYCMHSDIPARVRYRIRLAFEELVQQILLPAGYLPVDVMIEYSAEEGKALVDVSYSGERCDPAESENELSFRVLKQSVDEVTYAYNPGAERSNTVKVLIRG